MVTYHGATVVLRLERLAAEGKIDKEYIGTLDGSAGNQTLYTKNFPITTSAGVTTDDETLVDVFTDDLTLGDWTEYLDDGSDFVITGATGIVVIQAAENQGGNAGERIAISYYTLATVSRGQGATIDFDRDVEDIHELGNAAPQELKAGHYSVSGSIDALYTTKDLLGKELGVSDFYALPTDFSFYICPNGYVNGEPYIKVANAKFFGFSLKSTLKGMVALNVKFKGLVVSAGSLVV